MTFIGAGAGEITGETQINTNFLITYLLIDLVAVPRQHLQQHQRDDRLGAVEGTIEYTFMAPVHASTK